MNRYPVWKYAIIVIALLVGGLYALPNFYGESPAVQISSAKPLLKVVAIPNRFLGMTILTLSFVGVYSLRNSMIDCALAAVFGLLGMVLKRLNLPVVPIILGMVLGGIMENKFRTSLPRIDSLTDWISRPIAAGIFYAVVGVLIIHFLGLWRARARRMS